MSPGAAMSANFAAVAALCGVGFRAWRNMMIGALTRATSKRPQARQARACVSKASVRSVRSDGDNR